MSDLDVTFTPDGLQPVPSGRTTASLDNAVYLSLFTERSWQDATRDGRYGSRIPSLLSRQLTNSTRLAVIDAAQSALGWMVRDGIAESVTVDAAIADARTLSLTVRISRPGGERALQYAVNWEATIEGAQ